MWTKGDLPAEARATLARGDKIAAIKIVREETGLGLAEAKALVERFEQGADPRATRSDAERGKLPLAALAALRHGDRIGAIRAVHTEAGLQLKDSKEAVDAYIAGNPTIRVEVESVTATRRRRLAFRLCVMTLLIAGAIYLMRC